MYRGDWYLGTGHAAFSDTLPTENSYALYYISFDSTRLTWIDTSSLNYLKINEQTVSNTEKYYFYVIQKSFIFPLLCSSF